MQRMKSIGRMVQNTEKFMLFDACELDFDLMTVVLKPDLDIMVTYFHTKCMVKRPLKVIVWKMGHTFVGGNKFLEN